MKFLPEYNILGPIPMHLDLLSADNNRVNVVTHLLQASDNEIDEDLNGASSLFAAMASSFSIGYQHNHKLLAHELEVSGDFVGFLFPSDFVLSTVKNAEPTTVVVVEKGYKSTNIYKQNTNIAWFVVRKERLKELLRPETFLALEQGFTNESIMLLQDNNNFETSCKKFIRNKIEMLEQSPEYFSHEENRETLLSEFTAEIEPLIAGILDGQQVLKNTTRQRSFQRAIAFIADNGAPIHEVQIKDICEAAFCSERTIQLAFREYLGMTLKQYLMALKLNNVRRHIVKEAKGTENLTEMVKALGVTHYGNFAKDYKRLFGEKPNETFKQIKQNYKDGLKKPAPLFNLDIER